MVVVVGWGSLVHTVYQCLREFKSEEITTIHELCNFAATTDNHEFVSFQCSIYSGMTSTSTFIQVEMR